MWWAADREIWTGPLRYAAPGVGGWMDGWRLCFALLCVCLLGQRQGGGRGVVLVFLRAGLDDGGGARNEQNRRSQARRGRRRRRQRQHRPQLRWPGGECTGRVGGSTRYLGRGAMRSLMAGTSPCKGTTCSVALPCLGSQDSQVVRCVAGWSGLGDRPGP
jgi:hypothetical protein